MIERIPLSTLLPPVSGSQPAGANLEYDARHLQMCQAAEPTRELEYGSTVVAAQAPDWRELYHAALELSAETRDIRVAVHLTEALCRLQGFVGLLDGLTLLVGWLENFWDDLYPPLDHDDNDDASMRLGALSRLCHADYLLDGIAHIPLAEDVALGSISLQDIRRAQIRTAEEPGHLTRSEVEAIFLSTPLNALQTTLENIRQCRDLATQLNQLLSTRVLAGQWDGTPLTAQLHACSQAIEQAFGQRGESPAPVAAAVPVTPETPTNQPLSGVHAAVNTAATTTPEVVAAITPESLTIETRAQAMAVLDSLCLYFQTHEPASPVPLLLQRAKRLIPMSFVDILRELAPNGLDQAMQSVGAQREESSC